MKPVTFPRPLLAECAKQRPPEYMVELLKARVSENAHTVTFDSEHPAYVALLVRHRQRFDLKKLGVSFGEPGRAVQSIEERGPALWAKLHKRPLEWPGGDDTTWLRSFHRELGCAACASDWYGWVRSNPPDFSSAAAYFEWGVRGHAHVCQRLNKPSLSLDEARRRWGYGAE